MMSATLYYVHDPMCSWCWGFRPTWDALQRALPASVAVINVAGGLAADCDQPMPIDMQRTIEGYWHSIQKQLGTEFNFDFWRNNQPRRSTYMACRATLAAANQNSQAAMINAIQRAYYLQARNPSDDKVLIQLATELGLEPQQFERDLYSSETETEFARQRALARQLPIQGFPSLVLKTGNHISRIDQDYLHVEPMLAAIEKQLCAG